MNREYLVDRYGKDFIEKIEIMRIEELLDIRIKVLMEDGVPPAKGRLYSFLNYIFEKTTIGAIYDHTKRNPQKTSEILGIHKITLKKKLKQYSLL